MHRMLHNSHWSNQLARFFENHLGLRGFDIVAMETRLIFGFYVLEIQDIYYRI